MYPEAIVSPMKAELTTAGFLELINPEDVDKAIQNEGTVLMVVNSVCGCAAGACRPGVKKSLENAKKPSTLTTVFAGYDRGKRLTRRENISVLIHQAVLLLRCSKMVNLFTLLNAITLKDITLTLFQSI